MEQGCEADWLDDAPAQVFPTREKQDVENAVQSALQLLEQASRGDAVAWAISEALSTLSSRCCGPSRIDEADLDALLDAISYAKFAGLCLLPSDFPREPLRIGLNALKALVWHWSEDECERAHRPRGRLADLRALARLLQNDLHSLCLCEELEERRQARIASSRVNLRFLPPPQRLSGKDTRR